MSAYKVQIEPIEKKKSVSSIEMFLQYVFNASDATVYVYFKDDDGSTVDIKTVYIPQEIYEKWTDTDDFLIEYILKELQLKKSISAKV